jgi:hypothetical protein
MKSLLVSVALGAGFLLSVGAYADAPAGSTAQCKDGTYYSGTTHKGACKGHQGVKEWLDKTAATPAATPAAAPASDAATTPTKKSKSKKTTDAAAPATAAAPAAAATPATPVAPPAATPAAPAAPAMAAKHTAPTPASQITAKPGGGPGQVWVNASSKVYHCQGDEWYGKTKEGSYMTEAAAKAAGNHASHGKDCG